MPLIYSFCCNWIFVTFDSLLGSFLVALMMVFFNAHLSHIAAMNLLNSILDLLFFLVNKFSLQWRESFLGSQPPNYKHIFGLRVLWATTKKTNFRYAVNFYLLNCRKCYGQGRKSYYGTFDRKSSCSSEVSNFEMPIFLWVLRGIYWHSMSYTFPKIH